MEELNTIKDIPMYSSWAKIKKVNKGWSDDTKFYIESDAGKKMLLRVSAISQFGRKRFEHDNIERIAGLGLRMSLPIEFGVCDNERRVYSLFTWVEGDDAEILLPMYSQEQQYRLGLVAGGMISRIHTLPAPPDQPDWGQRFRQKIDRKLREYRSGTVRVSHDTHFLSYIEENMDILDNRPQTLQHGDYHVGNLVISQDGQVGVIDFNRLDFGDPWEEFNRCVFSWRSSVPFTIGQIHGYFDGKAPDEFFRLMALYIAVNTIGSIAWAIPFGSDDVQNMMENAEDVYQWYDGFQTHIPVWYREPEAGTKYWA